MIWHSATSQQVVEELQSNIYKGLTSSEAAERLRKNGANALKDKKRRTLPQIILAELKSTTLLIVLAAAVIWFITSWLLHSGNQWGAVVIVGIALVEVAIDVVKETCAANALDSLRNVSQPSAHVIRDGQTVTLPATKLVPGDILCLEQGDYIPADARLIRCELLRCDEKTVTGEPVSVEKQVEEELSDIVPIEKRSNMVYSGSTVANGSALAVVVATGMNTEAAKIALVVEDSLRITTPLQKQWKTTAKSIGAAAGVVSVIIFVLGILLSDGSLFQRFGNTFMTCAALAAAAVPESLAATITTVLAVGVGRMVRHKLLVTDISAVETLSKVSIICTDKTGTLTSNRMTMTRLFNGKETLPLQENSVLEAPQKNLLLMGAMCCDADVHTENGEEQLIGDHTEAAIVAAAVRYSEIDKQTLDSMYPRLCVLPFDADRKLKTSVNMIDGKPVAVVKGAPDIIISRCNNCDQKTATQAARSMAKEALRVIGIAFKPLSEAPANPTQEELEHDLIFGGLVGLEDPPIPEAATAVEDAKKAGIQVVMMTGDHVSTAVSSAKQLGIMTEDASVITNDELESLSDEELDDLITRFRVYVRLSPENKQRVVTSLQRKGFVVAITGDRVEDASVLRQADVGCAMGENGTDVAKGAAHVTVNDDHFATIVDGIGAARGIYENLCKSIRFALGFVLGLGVVMLLGLVIWGQLPLNAVQIMCLNLLVSAASVLPVGLEPPAKGLMNQPPRTDDRIFDKQSGIQSLIHGGLLGAAALIAFGAGHVSGQGATMAFAVLGFGQLLCAFSARSRYSLLDFKRHHFNYWLVLSLVLASAVLIAILNVDWMNGLFGVETLKDGHIGIVAGLSLMPFLVTEILKLPGFVKGLVTKE